MGSVVQWPPRHGRASMTPVSTATGRAAKAAKSSAVKPADLEGSVARIEDHHSAGMLSRCHHLDTADAPAPMDSAMPSREGQSSITERKEFRSDMGSLLGQSVLNCKADLSCDLSDGVGHNVPMADRLSETEEKLAFIRRVRLARESKFRTQRPVYEFLGVPQDQYKHWETSREMPRKHIPKFCVLTETDPEWLLTGEGEAPQAIEYPEEVPKRRRGRKPSRSAA